LVIFFNTHTTTYYLVTLHQKNMSSVRNSR